MFVDLFFVLRLIRNGWSVQYFLANGASPVQICGHWARWHHQVGVGCECSQRHLCKVYKQYFFLRYVFRTIFGTTLMIWSKLDYLNLWGRWFLFFFVATSGIQISCLTSQSLKMRRAPVSSSTCSRKCSTHVARLHKSRNGWTCKLLFTALKEKKSHTKKR